MRDFTLKKYKLLLQNLKENKFIFQTFEEFLKKHSEKSIVLRHDVDLMPDVALKFAQIQAELDIRGSYYFRAVPESWDETIIHKISDLGHEIGYHYENLTVCKGEMELAIKDFEINLEKLRDIAPVATICMHGSPRSKYDAKDLWNKYNYREYGIIGEPYFDIDFNEVYYLTDTGRMWDGHKFSVRDKVSNSYEQSYHSTDDIIDSVKCGGFPSPVMFTFHPARWHDNYLLWLNELILQNLKNTIKKHFFIKNK